MDAGMPSALQRGAHLLRSGVAVFIMCRAHERLVVIKTTKSSTELLTEYREASKSSKIDMTSPAIDTAAELTLRRIESLRAGCGHHEHNISLF